MAFFADGSLTPVTGCGAVAVDSNGQGSCTTSTLGAGSHSIAAVYGGDSSAGEPVLLSSTGTLAGGVTINPVVATTTSVTSSNSSTYGQTVTFTANVTGSDNGGTVTISADSATICTTGLSGTGSAGCSTPALTVGTHAITAVYSGDSGSTGSNATLTGGQSVSPATVTVTASNATMTYGATPPAVTPSYSGFVLG